MVFLADAKRSNPETLISATSKWTDLKFQPFPSSKIEFKTDFERTMYDTNDILKNQYLGARYERTSSRKVDVIPVSQAHVKGVSLPSKDRKTEISWKIGALSKEELIKNVDLPKFRANGQYGGNLGYASKIRQSLDNIKNKETKNEFLDYAKYHRYKPQSTIPIENTQEFIVNSTSSKIDQVDLRRALIELKVPFYFKTERNENMNKNWNDGQMSILLKGKPEQIEEWRNKIEMKGVALTNSKKSFPLSSQFSDTRFLVANYASQSIESRNKTGKITKNLIERKKELLKSLDNNQK